MAEILPISTDPVAGLIDVPLPSPVSLFPQTPMSRIAILALLAIVILAIWRFAHYWRVNRYRREALSELDRIEARFDTDKASEDLATNLSVLVRRTALATFPRAKVAPLAGRDWLAFLDRTYGGSEFSQDPGRLLASAPYQQRSPNDADLTLLVRIVRRWIRWHRV